MYPEEGRVLWDGEDVRRDLRGFHARLAYLGHEPPLKGDLTAGENLRYWIGVRRRLSLADLDAALARVGAGGCSARRYARCPPGSGAAWRWPALRCWPCRCGSSMSRPPISTPTGRSSSGS